MFRRVLLTLLTLNLMFCTSKQETKLSREYVRELASGNFNYPSRHSFDILFCRVEHGNLVQTNVNVLHHVYNSQYASGYRSFESFLVEVLDGKIALQESFFADQHALIFKIQPQVTKQYNDEGFDSFFNNNCERLPSGSYKIRKMTERRFEINSILYYVFINNFKIRIVDTENSFIISRLDD